MIRVLFFAQLREQLGAAELQIAAENISSVAALKESLVTTNFEWAQFLSNNKLLVAVNHEYVKGDVVIKSGDEVAFFPPVTGG
ncbi:MAG: moaD [Cellvibrio sp.]|jgi:molybdopterin synthase sulfur carrier subunit|nr:moaD [Cellvibrio sp.]